MKNKILLLIALQTLLLNLNAQKIKSGNYNFKYEVFPTYSTTNDYKTYKVAVISSASDGIPLDKNKINCAGKYIPSNKYTNIVKLEEIDPVNGFFGAKNADRVFNPKYKYINTEAASDLEIIIDYKNIEMINKENYFTATNNSVPQPNVPATCFNYKLTFKLPYTIKIIDKRKNLIICDTTIVNTKFLLYPASYSFVKNEYGGEVQQKPNGDINPIELKLNYEKTSASINQKSKSLLMTPSFFEQEYFLKQFLLFSQTNYTFNYMTVKTKNPLFDICDTASNLVNQITDSISFNCKNEKHVNWHTTNIKNLASKLNTLWLNMLNDEKYLSQFKEADDINVYKHGLKVNLAMVNLMLDDFTTSQNYLNEVKLLKTELNSDFPNYANYINTLSLLLDKEKSQYKKHELIYNFK
jgi:hypothetical protein